MIRDSDAEAAADYLRDSAAEFGRLKGERIYQEEYLRSVRATLASFSNATSEAARDREALAHDQYQKQLTLLREAVTAEETARARRVAAEMRIEVWRSISANQRGRI